MKTTTHRHFCAVAAVGIAVAGLGLSGCSGEVGGDSGSTVGFNEFTRASATDMPVLCEKFFGTAAQIGTRLDLTLYDGEEAAGGVCLYETNTGGSLALVISEEKPAEATLYARGENYYVILGIVDGDKETISLSPDASEKATKWLEDRVNAVTDDYDKWTAGLPATTPGFAASEGFTMEDHPDPTDLSGTLFTPTSRVDVHSVSTPKFLYIGDDATAPAKGEKFIVASVNINPDTYRGDAPTIYAVYIDDEPAPANMNEALNNIVNKNSSQLALSVPVDAEDVTVVVTTSDTQQAISVKTGTVEDNGESELLAASVSKSVAPGTHSIPLVVDEYGDIRNKGGYWSDQDEGAEASWSLDPWAATAGWAPKGQSYFVLQPAGNFRQVSMPLTPADATVTIAGTDYPAVAWDITNFYFLIPDDVKTLDVEIRLTRDTSKLATDPGTYGGQQWGAGWKITTPETMTWTINISQGEARQN